MIGIADGGGSMLVKTSASGMLAPKTAEQWQRCARQLWSACCERVIAVFNHEHRAPPCFCLLALDEQRQMVIHLLYPNMCTTEEATTAVRDYSGHIGALICLTIMEAWMVFDAPDRLDMTRSLEHHPQRVEAVNLLLEAIVPGIEPRAEYALIERPADGPPRLAQWKALSAALSGRFTSLLSEPQQPVQA